MDTERFLRQLDIVPYNEIQDRSASVIGCGAIGRQLSLQLAAIGIPKIQLIDFDTVEDHNRTTQGYRLQDLGEAKVDALQDAIFQTYDDIDIEVCKQRFPHKSIELNPLVFVCVDSIKARKNIWNAVKKTEFELFIDCRMLAENMHVIAILPSMEDMDFYQSTLFSESVEAHGSCTGRMTIYSAGVCAGLATHQFTRHLRKLRINRYKAFNMIAQSYSNLSEGFAD